MSWSSIELGSICEILDSKRKPITKNQRTDGPYPYYGATGIVDYIGSFIFDEKLILIGEDGAKWSSGDKTAFIADGKYWVNNHAHVIKPNREVVCDEWLVYYFLYKDLSEYVSGLTVPKLNQGQLKIIPIPLPSLATQHKIVTKLDAIFAEIDKAVLATEANVKNAEALFQSHLLDVFHKPNTEWTTKKLKDITKKITDGSHNPPKGIEFSNFLMLSSKNIENDNITFDSPRYLNESDFNVENKRTSVSYGDVLLTIVGTIGRCAVFENENIKVALQRSVAVIKPTEIINSRFLMYAFLSSSKFLNERARGVAQKGIYLETLRELNISFPTYENQILIVERLDTLSSEIKRVSNHYSEKLEQITTLKNAVLAKAFNGELVKD